MKEVKRSEFRSKLKIVVQKSKVCEERVEDFLFETEGKM